MALVEEADAAAVAPNGVAEVRLRSASENLLADEADPLQRICEELASVEAEILARQRALLEVERRLKDLEGEEGSVAMDAALPTLTALGEGAAALPSSNGNVVAATEDSKVLRMPVPAAVGFAESQARPRQESSASSQPHDREGLLSASAVRVVKVVEPPAATAAASDASSGPFGYLQLGKAPLVVAPAGSAASRSTTPDGRAVVAGGVLLGTVNVARMTSGPVSARSSYVARSPQRQYSSERTSLQSGNVAVLTSTGMAARQRPAQGGVTTPWLAGASQPGTFMHVAPPQGVMTGDTTFSSGSAAAAHPRTQSPSRQNSSGSAGVVPRFVHAAAAVPTKTGRPASPRGRPHGQLHLYTSATTPGAATATAASSSSATTNNGGGGGSGDATRACAQQLPPASAREFPRQFCMLAPQPTNAAAPPAMERMSAIGANGRPFSPRVSPGGAASPMQPVAITTAPGSTLTSAGGASGSERVGRGADISAERTMSRSPYPAAAWRPTAVLRAESPHGSHGGGGGSVRSVGQALESNGSSTVLYGSTRFATVATKLDGSTSASTRTASPAPTAGFAGSFLAAAATTPRGNVSPLRAIGMPTTTVVPPMSPLQALVSPRPTAAIGSTAVPRKASDGIADSASTQRGPGSYGGTPSIFPGRFVPVNGAGSSSSAPLSNGVTSALSAAAAATSNGRARSPPAPLRSTLAASAAASGAVRQHSTARTPARAPDSARGLAASPVSVPFAASTAPGGDASGAAAGAFRFRSMREAVAAAPPSR
eukprot:TRINITY_DN17469_c0_g1_i2.p1 TRINITY_DN17469_c0_g1~~TRINITY_DN17469_c0_g1_i2.p1  ORF type:complete len:771 (-),score=141.95 TRINITY_DN17469_c0_g1_i2:64-2376(-)